MLELDMEEREILADVLETFLADLRMEIGRTDRQDYRMMLKKRKAVLEKVIAGVRGEETPKAAASGKGPLRP